MRRFKIALAYLLLSALTVTSVLRAFADEPSGQEESTQTDSCKDQPGGYCRIPGDESAPNPMPTPEPLPEVSPDQSNEEPEAQATMDEHQEHSGSESQL